MTFRSRSNTQNTEVKKKLGQSQKSSTPMICTDLNLSKNWVKFIFNFNWHIYASTASICDNRGGNDKRFSELFFILSFCLKHLPDRCNLLYHTLSKIQVFYLNEKIGKKIFEEFFNI